MARLALVQTQKQGQRQPMSYLACSAPRDGTLLCNKRVDESGTCPVCGSVGKGVARLNARCRFVDCVDSAWMTTFHEGAESLFGMAGSDVHSLEQRADGDGADVEGIL